MDALEFFLLRYESLHGRNNEELLGGLTDDQIRRSPLPSVNSIAWLLWHMTRCEDVGISRLVADRPQVLLDGDWPARVNVSLTDIGTGMVDDEVADFGARVDLEGLRAYRAAVKANSEPSLPKRRLRVKALLSESVQNSLLDRACRRGTLGRPGILLRAGNLPALRSRCPRR